MFAKTLDMDVQIHREEINKPSDSSLVLVPLRNNSLTVHQLALEADYQSVNLTPRDIDEVGQKIFQEWSETFPLYPIERAFADILISGRLGIYITFDSSNIFSETQLRNIKKTISDVLKSEISRVIESSKEKSMLDDSLTRSSHSSLKEYEEVDLDLIEKFSYLKQENDELQSALQQNKFAEFSQKDRIDALHSEIERQQYSMSNLYDNVDIEQKNTQQKIQESLEETRLRLRQNQHELLGKQREIQRLQSIVAENTRYVDSLQSDYDQLREVSSYQLEKTLEENDGLKVEVINYRNQELEQAKAVQELQSELRQIVAETDNLKEELKQKLQHMQIENEELRTIIKENQVFEERTHQDLVEATHQLRETSERMKELEQEKQLISDELETRISSITIERDELALAYKASRDLELSRSSELLELRNHLISLEQRLQQAELEKTRIETSWQTKYTTAEREKELLIQQVILDKEQFVSNKEQEIKRLSDRLAQQKELVDKLMDNQTGHQELNLKSTELELELSKLQEANQLLEVKLAKYEETDNVVDRLDEEVVIVELDELDLEIEKELAEPQVEDIVIEEITDEDIYYNYEDEQAEDSDYEYDYEYDDYDYEYHEVDELINYNPEQVEEDVEEFLANNDEEGKSKIRKKDYDIYELYINHLPNLIEQASEEEFLKFVEPKMKKFKKFKKEFEEEVKPPTLFSRKYKLETGLFNQLQAYVLMSRHLSILLDVEISEDDYEYEYDYEYDYDYDYEDDYEYDEK